jgi:cytochrome b561
MKLQDPKSFRELGTMSTAAGLHPDAACACVGDSMPDESSPTRYTTVAQLFHWLIAALIATQFALAWTAEDLPLGMHKLAVLARHKSFGMTVLVLAILRLLWRFKNPPPVLPAGMTPIGRTLARATHVAFYILLFAMPLTGWMMSSAKNYSVSWFGLFTWPNLIARSDAAFGFFKSAHDYLSDALFVIAILHVLAALKHHFWNKDDVFLRMLPLTKPSKARTEKRW